MNVFFLIDDELVTPSLESSILEGVTRNTVIHLAREWGEIRHNDALITINGGKTGAFSQKLYNEITAMQYSEKDDEFGWCHWIK